MNTNLDINMDANMDTNTDIINNNESIKELIERNEIAIREAMESNEMNERRENQYAIFRFKFTEEFMEELYKFSKIHQYDERKDFKEAWQLWVDENLELVDTESRRLNMLGYEGDILTKMFKSARYYFRKKSTVPVEPKQRRQYISVNHELLEAMDTHVKTNIRTNGYQPKTGFVSFCKENEVILKQTITNIFEQGIKDAETIQTKLKKTYKNRYFILITNK
jgi:hypothetical protein